MIQPVNRLLTPPGYTSNFRIWFLFKQNEGENAGNPISEGKVPHFSLQIHHKSVFNKNMFSPRKLTWNLKNHPLEKEQKIKHLQNLHCLGSFILIFGMVSSESMWKVYWTNPTENSAAKRQWHVHQRRQVQNQRSRRKRMPTRSIECSQKMWRCVGVAMHFDDFVSEIRLLIFFGEGSTKLLALYILIFQLSILKVNHFDQMAIVYLPGRFMWLFFPANVRIWSLLTIPLPDTFIS